MFLFFTEKQTRYKIVAGSVCGFSKFVTSGSGLGSGFSNIQFWVWVRVQGSKIFQKTGFWVQVWVGFCKKHQNTTPQWSIWKKFGIKSNFRLFLRKISCQTLLSLLIRKIT
jgi:hypothetical protein